MKRDRKIDSSDTTIVSSEYGNASKGGHGEYRLLSHIHAVNQITWTTINHICPALTATISPRTSDIERLSRACFSRSQMALMFLVVGDEACMRLKAG
jgi:hypothetical protein